jgi:hypothetical protein
MASPGLEPGTPRFSGALRVLVVTRLSGRFACICADSAHAPDWPFRLVSVGLVCAMFALCREVGKPFAVRKRVAGTAELTGPGAAAGLPLLHIHHEVRDVGNRVRDGQLDNGFVPCCLEPLTPRVGVDRGEGPRAARVLGAGVHSTGIEMS